MIHEVHQASNYNVELVTFDESPDVREEFVGESTKPSRTGRCVDADVARDILSHAPRTGDELVRARDGHISPIDVILGRSGEGHCDTHRVHAEIVEFLSEEDDVPLRLRHLCAIEDDHPLVQQGGERFVEIEITQVEQNLGDEARIKQVQDCVLDTTDVLIDGRPLFDRLDVKRLRVISGREEAEEIPRGIHKSVHRVGVTFRGASVTWIGNVDPVRRGTEWR